MHLFRQDTVYSLHNLFDRGTTTCTKVICIIPMPVADYIKYPLHRIIDIDEVTDNRSVTINDNRLTVQRLIYQFSNQAKWTMRILPRSVRIRQPNNLIRRCARTSHETQSFFNTDFLQTICVNRAWNISLPIRGTTSITFPVYGSSARHEYNMLYAI